MSLQVLLQKMTGRSDLYIEVVAGGKKGEIRPRVEIFWRGRFSVWFGHTQEWCPDQIHEQWRCSECGMWGLMEEDHEHFEEVEEVVERVKEYVGGKAVCWLISLEDRERRTYMDL
jgi:hypothetical protein